MGGKCVVNYSIPSSNSDNLMSKPEAISYNLNLFPNPVNYSALTIEYDLPENSSVQFKITDCIGRILFAIPPNQEAAGAHSKEINVSNFAGGVYFFIADINGEVKTIKFIKI
jgi:hypothetical protein